MSLRDRIASLRTFDEQEAADREYLLSLLESTTLAHALEAAVSRFQEHAETCRQQARWCASPEAKAEAERAEAAGQLLMFGPWSVTSMNRMAEAFDGYAAEARKAAGFFAAGTLEEDA